jgi:hypothetical protein
MLDPNQGVCGRGIIQLQEAGISVELFPHELAEEIRAMNREFVLAQQAISPQITAPKENEREFVLESRPFWGWYTTFDVEFTCNNPPGPDVWLVVENAGVFWPQSFGICYDSEKKCWKGKVGIGSAGTRTVHIVKANPLGHELLGFHKTVIDRNEHRKKYLREKLPEKAGDDEFWSKMPNDYQGIALGTLPTGLDTLAHVTVEIKKPKGG